MPPSRLAELRRVKGWTLRELAQRVGIDYSSLAMYEKRIREPRVSSAMKLVRLFDGDLRYEDLAMSTAQRDTLRRKKAERLNLKE
jgi:transcriptional regulator with XRE-family HTH domain